MTLYSGKGKYVNRKAGAARRKRKTGIILLAGLFLVSVALAGTAIWYFGNSRRAANSFQALSQQVQAVASQEAEIPTMPVPAQLPEQTETLPEQVVQTSPETEPGERPILKQYEALYQENMDLFGWLTIADTVIDYPVMHTPDEPERYLHADFQKAYSYGGVPFIDAKCRADSDNLLIYGHNMLDGSMFRSLMKYEKKTFWEEHPVITFNTLYEEQEYEVLAAFYDRVYYKTENVFKFYQFIDAADEADYDHAISQFKQKSIYDTGVDASYGDQLITLVTCAYHVDNGRFVVVARRK